MFKALFKKQMLEMNQFYFINKKTGKRRKGLALFSNILLYIVVFGIVAVVFGSLALQLGSIIIPLGSSDVYFAVMSIAAVVFGVVGSVFNTYAGLYRSKDNELLLSMPIRPSLILLSRMVGVYSMSLLYEGLVLIPSVVVYFIIAGFSVSVVIAAVWIFLASALFVLSFTCLFGWIVAFISSKLKNRNIVVTILSVALFLLYYRGISKMSSLIELIAASGEEVGAGIKTYAYPIYVMAKSLTGDILSIGIFTIICLALFAVTWFILSKTFIKIATKPITIAQNKKIEKVKSSGLSSTLLKREFKHFTSCSIWMLNNGLGALLLLIGTVFVLIKSGSVEAYLGIIPSSISQYTVLALTGIVMFIMSLDAITAPSISIEGSSLWIVQTLPIRPKDILLAKLKMHLIVNCPPSLVFIVAVAYVVKLSPLSTILCILCVLGYTMLVGLCGLALDINRCNLHWKNIMVPVKQGMPIFVCIFGGMGYVILMGVGSFFALQVMSPEICLICVFAITAILCGLLFGYVCGKGAKKFEKLS